MSEFTDQFTALSFPNLGLVRFPEIVISQEDRLALGLKETASNRDVLKHLAYRGYQSLRARGQFDGIPDEVVIARFKMEFATFDLTNVHDYLLLVWDINRWCDSQGIVRGYGRGSAASSLTLYCVGITRVNPLRHNLNFPRFISEARMKPVIKDGVVWVDGTSAPDIDCDYEYLRRADVVAYIEAKYPGRVSKISTTLELTGKMALKDVLKVYAGYADEEAKAVSDLIEVKYGEVQSLSEAYEQGAAFKEWVDKTPANREIYELAMSIEGLAVAKGQHPSGVFIGYDLLDDTIPLETSKTGDIVSCYGMETMSSFGIKADILGVRTLDLVAGAARIAGIAVDSIDVNDPSIYEYVKTHESYLGLFQIGEGLTKQVVRKVQPRDIDAFAVCLAISRPGALKYIDEYAAYIKDGTFKTIYPAIDSVLKSTGNVLVFQEQITHICHHVFGLTEIDADQVRYAVGKKKKDKMALWEPIIQEGGRSRAVPDSVIKYFWDVCEASASYLFVLSHAVAYVYLTAATTFLKANHPLAFYLTMLKLAREEPNPTEYMNQIITEMAGSGIKLLPPDIIKSEADFSIQEGAIRFGLQSIKGVSESTMTKLASCRREFTSRFEVFEAARSAKVPINVLTSLIYSGCLDTKGVARSYYALNAQLYNLLTDREKPLVHMLGAQYGDDLIALLKDLPLRKDEKGKPLIRESRLNTLRRDYRPYWEMYQQNAKNEELTSYLFEKTLLGFSYTSTLHACYSRKVVGLTSLGELTRRAAVVERDPKEQFRVVAFVVEAKKHLSRSNNTPYLKLKLADDSHTTMAMVYGKARLDGCLSFNGQLPEIDDIVIASGGLSKEGSMLFLESCLVQAPPVAFKRGLDTQPQS